MTGKLHVQVHPCAAGSLIIDPIPASSPNRTENSLYPDGATIDDLAKTREILYSIQRPGISPHLVVPIDWQEKDLALFNNRGVLHSVVGAFKPDQVRMFHQCNLAASSDPVGPNAEDIATYA